MKKRKSIFKILIFILTFAFVGGLFGQFAVGANAVAASTQTITSISSLEGTDLGGAKEVSKTDEKYIPTVSYITGLDNGYQVSGATRNTFLRKNGVAVPFVKFYVDALGNGGEVYKSADNVNGYNAYGYVAGEGEPVYKKTESGEIEKDEKGEPIVLKSNYVQIKLQYNFASNDGISAADGNTWNISEDNWKKGINGMPSIGVVKKGAILVQKFVPTADKQYPTSNDDFKRDNPYSDKQSVGLHNVDMFNYYNPERHQEPFAIYQPSGSDMQKGVYIKITVAYEIERSYWSGWWIFGSTKTEYKNIVEETCFYLCNTSGEVVFENLYFENPNTNEGESGEQAASSGTEKKGGPISNNQGSIDGFRLDTRGSNFDITYRFNNSTNEENCTDGQVFLTPGKYDFKIRTKIGVTRNKTVYVHEYGNDTNKEVYFGDSLFAEGAQRVFMPSEQYPVFVAGKLTLKTQDEGLTHAPLVGKVFKLDGDWDSTKREDGLPVSGLVSEKSASNKNWSYSVTEAGKYEAVFANNEEYFSGTATGDTYTFVWRFSVTKEGLAPSVNKEALEGQIGVSDYANLHYVVKLPTKGEGKLLVVFFDELSAYNYASQYLASTVKTESGKYNFDGKAFDTEKSMLEALRVKAQSLVEKRYFDLTDSSTYLSLESSIVTPVLGDKPTKEEQEYYDNFVSILNRTLTKDVLVFTKEEALSQSVVGELFLNDRVYAYYCVDDEGNVSIKTGTKPIYFIQVSDYETQSVVLVHQASGKSYNVPYGVSVEQFLFSKSALSGKYTIIETNSTGVTEYEATYIRKGDCGIKLDLEWTLDGITLSRPNFISIADADTRLKANNFILKGASGTYDEFGIVKIKKNDGTTLIYSFEELENVKPFDEEGAYQITAIDRLGNSYSIYVDIYSSSKLYEFELENNGEKVQNAFAFDGKVFELPTLESSDPELEFAGWADESGKIYKNTYTFAGTKNVKLSAVYHYKNVVVSVFDGNLKATYSSKVGEPLALPELSKEGFKLYGYKLTEDEENYRFFRGQIGSVPNEKNIRLDAIWIRLEEEITLQEGSENNVAISLVDGSVLRTLTVLKTEKANLGTAQQEDMTFAGWLYEYGLEGAIFEDEFSYSEVSEIGLENENAIKLSAIWVSNQTDVTTPIFVAGGTLTSTGTANGVGAFLASNAGVAASVVAAAGMSMLAFMTIMFVKKRRVQNEQNFENEMTVFEEDELSFAGVGAQAKEILKQQKLFEKEQKAKQKQTAKALKKSCRQAKEDKPRRSFYQRFIAPCIAAVLTLSLLAIGQSTLLFAGKARIEEANAKSNTSQTFESDDNDYLDQVYSDIKDSDDEEFSADEYFLYALVQTDLFDKGYEDVFTAYAKFTDAKTGEQKVVKGLGFTNYNQAFKENGETLFDAGFVAYYGEYQLTAEDISNGVLIERVDQYDFAFNNFKLMLKENFGPYHYVAYDKYVYYQVMNNSIIYTSTENEEGCYIDAYGDVYNYDIGDYCHFVNYNTEFNLDAFSITSETTYEDLLEIFRGQIEQQNLNAVEINIEKADFISYQALYDYNANGQDESLLGVPAEELLYYEANIANNQYYVILEDGTVKVLDIPPDKASIWQRIWVGLSSIAVAVVGIVICSAFPGLGSIVGGALISGAIDLFMQVTVSGVPPKDIDWVSVGKSALIGGVTGGIGAYVSSVTGPAIKLMTGFTKVIAKVGTQVVSGLMGGAASYFITSQFDENQEFSFKDCMKAMLLGGATGMIMGFGDVIVQKVAHNINFLEVIGTIIAGTVGSIAGYYLSCAIMGIEPTTEGLLLAVGMGAAMSTLTLVGGKIVKTYKNYRENKAVLKERIDQLPGPDSDWKITNGEGISDENIISKEQLLKNKGNGAFLEFDAPDGTHVKYPIKDGFIDCESMSEFILKDQTISGNRDLNFKNFERTTAEMWSKDNKLIPDDCLEFLAGRKGMTSQEALMNGISVSKKDIEILMNNPNNKNPGLGYTFHECGDLKTVQFVKQEYHSPKYGGPSHYGGVTESTRISNQQAARQYETQRLYEQINLIKAYESWAKK